MAVTINDIPKLAFTKNEVKVQLTSDNYIDQAGAIGVYRLDFDLVTNIDTKALYFNFQNARYLYGFGQTSSGMPWLGYPIPPYVTGDSKATYAVKLRDALDAAYWMNDNFIVSVDGESILLTARAMGADYVLSAESEVFTLTEETAPQDRTIRDNFRHHLQVWNAGLSKKLFETDIPLDYPETGVSTVDISSVLHALVSLDVPNLTDVFQRCPNSVFNYIIKYANRYGDNQSIKSLTKTSPLCAVYGGYSMMALLHITSPTHLQNYLMTSPSLYELQNWFEAYPSYDITVKTNEPQFLYFVNSRSVPEVVRLYVDVTLQDGTKQNTVLEAGEVASYEKICFAVGYLALGLDAFGVDGNRVSTYQVFVLGPDNEPRTVIKTFTVDRQYEANTRYFLYAGSEGNYKTLRTYGAVDSEANFDTVSGELIGNQAQRLQQGDALTFDVTSVESEEVNTGYIIGSQDQNALQELFLSPSVFRVFGLKLVPIRITGTSMQLAKERTGAHSIKIAYRIAWNNKQFTGNSWALDVPAMNSSQEALNDI